MWSFIKLGPTLGGDFITVKSLFIQRLNYGTSLSSQGKAQQAEHWVIYET